MLLKELIQSLLFVALLIWSTDSRCQELKDSSSPCYYLVRDNYKKKPTEVRIAIPCDWAITTKTPEGTQRTFINATDSVTMASLIGMGDISMLENQEQVPYKEKEWAVQFFKGRGDVLSESLFRIDDHQWSEYIVRSTIKQKEAVIRQYALMYHIVFHNTEILITYKCYSKTPDLADRIFEMNILAFRKLASEITVNNLW